MLIESLPESLAFDLLLNQSYDENRNPEHEQVFPEDSHKDPASLRNLSHQEVECELWREGHMPAWIDLRVAGIREETTIIEAVCCGRFTDNEDFLYHNYEGGTPPFSIKGPFLPLGWESVEKDGRFSLYRKRSSRWPSP